jgi:hypothetical protein
VREYRFELFQHAIFTPQLTRASRWGRWPQDRTFWIEQSQAETYDIKTVEGKLKALRERAS